VTDRQALSERWERLGPVVIMCVAVLAIDFGVAMTRVHDLGGRFDLGYFDQAAWLIAHGKPAFVTVRGLYLLGDHFSPVFWPIAELTRVFPTTGTLLFVQSACLALGVLPLWRIARRHGGLSVGTTAAVVGAYALYPALGNVNVADFHPEVVAVPVLLAAVLCVLERRWLLFGLAVLVALLCKEDFSVVIAALGLTMLIDPETRTAGAITAVVGVVTFFVATRVVQSHYAGTFVQATFLSQYGSNLGTITKTMLLHPGRVVSDLTADQNFTYVVAMLAPLLFLPLLAPKWILPAIPIQVLYLLSTRPDAHRISGQYTIALSIFLVVAAVFAIAHLAGPNQQRLALLLLGAAFLTNAASGPLHLRPWQWRDRQPSTIALLDAARMIPPGAAVSGSERTWPVLFERQNLYGFPAPWRGYFPAKDPVALPQRQAGVRYVLIDTTDPNQWPGVFAKDLAELKGPLKLRPLFDRDGVQLYAVGP
jgi:uncharacterized membrane protein